MIKIRSRLALVLICVVCGVGVSLKLSLGETSTYAQGASRLFDVRSLSSASTDETLGASVGADAMGYAREVAVYVDWSTSVVSGEVCVETAHDAAYVGTWAVLSPCITFAGTAPKQDVLQMTGVHGAVRTRVNTVVSGGTGVTTWIIGN